MAESLAVKYRPTDWQSVCSQDSIIKILTRQLNLQQVKNAYLFCGASGCGKTTLARIFSNEINNYVGAPIEIDAASNNGVDNVKAIIKSAQERSIDSKYKIYIIDECHALTNQAWQAFLKCIEEPPTYTIFIFCTTDPQKIPATILNRVQRFNFTRINTDKIRDRLNYICRAEGFTNYEASTEYISKICNGGMRDAISMLDKCASYDTDLSINNVLASLGNYSYDKFFKLMNDIIDDNEAEVLYAVDNIHNDGNDLKIFIDQFLSFGIDINKYILFGSCQLLKIPSSMESSIQGIINFENSQGYYNYVVDKLLDLKNMIKADSNIKLTIEVMFLQMCRGK